MSEEVGEWGQFGDNRTYNRTIEVNEEKLRGGVLYSKP
jgi:hypothetical protein